MDDSNDLSLPDDFTAPYSEKTAELWREVLATGERHIGALMALGVMLNEWKAVVK